MKKLFDEQKVSLYKIQNDLGLDIKRLYRYADGTCNIKKMPTKLILDLAYYFKIEPNRLYKLMLDYQQQKEVRK